MTLRKKGVPCDLCVLCGFSLRLRASASNRLVSRWLPSEQTGGLVQPEGDVHALDRLAAGALDQVVLGRDDDEVAARRIVRVFRRDADRHAVGVDGVCLLYTSDAADERSSVDLGGRRIIKKQKT